MGETEGGLQVTALLQSGSHIRKDFDKVPIMDDSGGSQMASEMASKQQSRALTSNPTGLQQHLIRINTRTPTTTKTATALQQHLIRINTMTPTTTKTATAKTKTQTKTKPTTNTHRRNVQY